MLNGWFTIFAQAVNFLILVWLLKRFLYKPILHAIDEREKGIAAQLATAEAKAATAQKERDDFQHKNEVFDQQREALMTKATDEAKVERDRLLTEAKTDSDTLRVKRQDALQVEQKNLNQEILRRTQEEVFAISRKTLADLANKGLEECMSKLFVARLRGMTGQAKDLLSAALSKKSGAVTVRSAFDLAPSQREAIEAAIMGCFAPEAKVQFQTAPELIGGIELSASGQKVAWSIADYLATLQKDVGDLMHADAKPEVKAETKPRLEPVAAATNGHA